MGAKLLVGWFRWYILTFQASANALQRHGKASETSADARRVVSEIRNRALTLRHMAE